MKGILRDWPALAAAGAIALGCGGGGGDTATDPNPPDGGGGGSTAQPTRIQAVSGGDQNGKTGVPLDEPLVVSVTDADGAGVSGVEVAWTVAEGDGSVSAASTSTNGDGEASVTFSAGATLGPSRITASVDGLDGSPVSFDVRTTVVLIRMQQIAFVTAGDGDDAVSVSVGDTIEWLNNEAQYQSQELHTATSDAVPPGGSPFDSGDLSTGQTFRFVPQVTGTWVYHCEFHLAEGMQGATIAVQ